MRQLLRRNADARVCRLSQPWGLRARHPALLPSAWHTHSSTSTATKAPGPLPRLPRCPQNHVPLVRETRVGGPGHTQAARGAWSQWGCPGWQHVWVPGLGVSRSCAGSLSGRSSGLTSRSSDTSRKPETGVVTTADQNPGFRMCAQVCVCGGETRLPVDEPSEPSLGEVPTQTSPARHGPRQAQDREDPGDRRVCASRGLPDTHVFIFTCETRAVQLVHSHDHSHNIFAVHDGRGQDVPCHVARQLISKGAEVGTLQGKRREGRGRRPADLEAWSPWSLGVRAKLPRPGLRPRWLCPGYQEPGKHMRTRPMVCPQGSSLPQSLSPHLRASDPQLSIHGLCRVLAGSARPLGCGQT